MLQLTFIAFLALLPLLATLTTFLLDELGCYGGKANMGQDEVFCMIKDINLGSFYEAVGTIAFFAIFLAPLTLAWIIGGCVAFFRMRRKTA